MSPFGGFEVGVISLCVRIPPLRITRHPLLIFPSLRSPNPSSKLFMGYCPPVLFYSYLRSLHLLLLLDLGTNKTYLRLPFDSWAGPFLPYLLFVRGFFFGVDFAITAAATLTFFSSTAGRKPNHLQQHLVRFG